MCGALALVKSEERVWTEQERTGDTRPNSQDITRTAVSNQLQLAPCVPHQAIIKAGLISKTQDLECQKLLTTFLFLMFYPIKRLLPAKLCERKVLMPSKWIEVVVMLIKYQQRAAVLIQAPSSQLKHPEKDECCLLCCRDDHWDAEECAYLIKKIIYVNTPCTCQLPQDK